MGLFGTDNGWEEPCANFTTHSFLTSQPPIHHSPQTLCIKATPNHMKTKQRWNRRKSLAQEAARLMYEEDVKEYFTAKQIAARRLLGQGNAKALRHRPHDLPSNGEIREALLQLASFHEGEQRSVRLFAMRVIALETMQALKDFSPGLIGSVSTGHVRRGSDIDIHVFTDSLESLEACLEQQGWSYETDEVLIRKNNTFCTYQHVHLERVFPIELSVHEPHEKRVVQRSSTDGKPIRRLSTTSLQALLRSEHPIEWEEYVLTQTLPNLEQWEQSNTYQTLADQSDNESQQRIDDFFGKKL